MLRTTMLAAAVTLATATASFASTGWTTSGVNFRSGPGGSYGVIGWIDRCSRITVGYRQGGWYQITWGGQRGWVASRYVTRDRAHCRRGY